MSNGRTLRLIGVLITAVVLLATVGPVIAHPAVPSVLLPTTPVPAEPPAALPPVSAGASSTPADADAPGLTPWIAAGALVLAGVALRRRARRGAILGLVLLLALFAFEDSLHSVHHGLDPKQAEACAVATASAHLSAVAVDGVLEASIVLIAAGDAAEPALSPLPARRLAPDQGRAPPAPTA